MEQMEKIVKSLRICAGEDPENEGCEECIFQTGDCHNGTALLIKAACMMEDLLKEHRRLQQDYDMIRKDKALKGETSI